MPLTVTQQWSHSDSDATRGLSADNKHKGSLEHTQTVQTKPVIEIFVGAPNRLGRKRVLESENS